MTIAKGDTLPAATLLKLGENGPEAVELASLTGGKRVVIFAVPGAFTPTCTKSHMPSFIETADQYAAKGVDLVCVSVNDPFVTDAWAKSTGADKAGITVLADAEGAFTKAIGMDFTAPPAGLIGRSKRYAMLVEDGKIAALHLEDNPGECSVSGGSSMLDEI
ncbi:peroxiredoxin [Paracoccus sp. p4-l81]|uniref:peroxiredoxin n=1 Tax=unclassified Paracoccus (in: a-proteobacteria) TaxID=2688777 RepID=UPI0035B847F9